jgi:hypothetical protein
MDLTPALTSSKLYGAFVANGSSLHPDASEEPSSCEEEEYVSL